MGIFGDFDFGDDVFGGDSPENPDAPLTQRVAWVFYDGVDTYVLPVNPDSASMPTPNRTLTFQATCTGKQVIYEGRPQTKKISFSGVTIEEGQYQAFKNWVNKRKQIQITDDLGQKYWVYLKSFKPQRRRNDTYPWLMDYSAEGVVLDRGSV